MFKDAVTQIVPSIINGFRMDDIEPFNDAGTAYAAYHQFVKKRIQVYPNVQNSRQRIAFETNIITIELQPWETQLFVRKVFNWSSAAHGRIQNCVARNRITMGGRPRLCMYIELQSIKKGTTIILACLLVLASNKKGKKSLSLGVVDRVLTRAHCCDYTLV
jgi:hypothetical protein